VKYSDPQAERYLAGWEFITWGLKWESSASNGEMVFVSVLRED